MTKEGDCYSITVAKGTRIILDALIAQPVFCASPVHVKTPRGMHLYYRAGGAVPSLRGEGLPVDIKIGARSYVVGPLSQRSDGGLYCPVRVR
jgi:hypothetical protein